MLAAARGALPDATLVRARAEAMPFRTVSADLVTAGTAFHWMPPAPTIAEVARVLRRGGWVAIFWRFTKRGTEPKRLVEDALASVGVTVPEGLPGALASPAVFDGSGLVFEADIRLDTMLDFTADEFHGYVSTVEWLRRLAGPAHGRFLDALATELARRHPEGIREPNEEFLLLARRS
jgi:SAM-dependent methyltransferase